MANFTTRISGLKKNKKRKRAREKKKVSARARARPLAAHVRARACNVAAAAREACLLPPLRALFGQSSGVERRRHEPAAIFRALLPLTMIQNYSEIGDLQHSNPVDKGA